MERGPPRSIPDGWSAASVVYKRQGQDIADTKADIVGQVGSVVIQQALDGDFKSQELFLRSKGGWSPTSTVNEVEQSENPDEDESAIDSLITLLGKNKPDATPDEDNG